MAELNAKVIAPGSAIPVINLSSDVQTIPFDSIGSVVGGAQVVKLSLIEHIAAQDGGLVGRFVANLLMPRQSLNDLHHTIGQIIDRFDHAEGQSGSK